MYNSTEKLARRRGKEAPRGKTMFPLPKPAHKKFYFRQDRAACCRGGGL